MRFQRTGSTTGTGLLVLIIILILLIGLIIVFSQQILNSISNIDPYANTVAILVAVIFPLSLLGVIIYQISRLIRDRTRRKPGARLKSRLIIFFSLITLLSSIPLSFLSIIFIDSTINFWLRAGIGEALKGGVSLSLDYYHERIGNLETFNKSSLVPVLLSDMETDGERTWKRIRDLNHAIEFVQVFDTQGREVFFAGNPVGRITNHDSIKGKVGSLPREERENVSILKNIREHVISGVPYGVVFGTAYPKEFDEYGGDLTESLRTFTLLDRFRTLFRSVVVGFYFFFSLPILLLVILISFLLTDNLIMPIVNLEEATRRVAEGDFSFRILTRTGDELSILAGSFNKMIQELEVSRKQLLHAEKISAWQEIAQRLAHEIKNPLTPIKLSAQRILRKYHEDRAEFEKILEPAINSIMQEVDNLDDLLKEFGEFAKLPDPSPDWVMLKDVVGEVTSMYRNLSGGVSIDFSNINHKTTIRVDYNQMKQVFANLFKNAIQAMPRGGDIAVSADLVKKDNRNYCRIQIRDNGAGIDEKDREKVFNPYFTTKSHGTGLGLAIVERIVFDHNGNIWFESEMDVGTTFYIDLPVGN